jgi:hypothetical protein
MEFYNGTISFFSQNVRVPGYTTFWNTISKEAPYAVVNKLSHKHHKMNYVLLVILRRNLLPFPVT